MQFSGNCKGKPPILSKFWAQGSPALTKILDPALGTTAVPAEFESYFVGNCGVWNKHIRIALMTALSPTWFQENKQGVGLGPVCGRCSDSRFLVTSRLAARKERLYKSLCEVVSPAVHSRTPLTVFWAAQTILSNFCFQKKIFLFFSNFFFTQTFSGCSKARHNASSISSKNLCFVGSFLNCLGGGLKQSSSNFA